MCVYIRTSSIQISSLCAKRLEKSKKKREETNIYSLLFFLHVSAILGKVMRPIMWLIRWGILLDLPSLQSAINNGNK